MSKRFWSVIVPVCWVACGGATPTSETANEPTAAATPAGDAVGESSEPAASPSESTEPPKKEETPTQRRKRLKDGRLAQCQSVGDAMDNIQQRVTITNVNDKPTLRRIAGELTKLSADMAKIQIEPELTDLIQLRDDHVSTTKVMAEDLAKAAETTDLTLQKQAIADFRKREAASHEFVPRLNEVCNAPIE